MTYILVGSISFAVSAIMMQFQPKGYSPIINTRNTVFFACLQIGLISFISPMTAIKIHYFSWATTISLLALGAICTALCYVLYFRLIHQSSATFASQNNYLVPIFGTFLGWLIFGIEANTTIMLSLFCVLLGVYLCKPKKINQ